MSKIAKTFRLLMPTKKAADPAAQTAAVVEAYQAALTEHELPYPETGFSLWVMADNDGDSDEGDAQVLYCVSDRYASWYVLARGTDAEVIAFYAYVYPEWADEEAFAYSESLEAVMKDAGTAPADKAEREEWLVKALNAEVEVEKTDETYAVVVKSDTQRYTLGVAYPHDEVDSHGDFTDEVELEKAAWTFMRDVIRKGASGVGTDHAEGTDDAAEVVESYIWRGPDWEVDLGDGETVVIKTGDWMVGAVWTEDAWTRIENGELTGWSIQGLARMDEDAELPDAD